MFVFIPSDNWHASQLEAEATAIWFKQKLESLFKILVGPDVLITISINQRSDQEAFVEEFQAQVHLFVPRLKKVSALVSVSNLLREFAHFLNWELQISKSEF